MEEAADRQGTQYLNAGKLRRALGGKGKGGEAHHIIPGNIVESMELDQTGDYNTEEFNEGWKAEILQSA